MRLERWLAIGLLVLLPRLGLAGAAWAMTIGYSARTAMLVSLFHAATKKGNGKGHLAMEVARSLPRTVVRGSGRR